MILILAAPGPGRNGGVGLDDDAPASSHRLPDPRPREISGRPGAADSGYSNEEGPRLRLGLQGRPLPFPLTLPRREDLIFWAPSPSGSERTARPSVGGLPLTASPGEALWTRRRPARAQSVGAPTHRQGVPQEQERPSIFRSEFAALDFQLQGRGEFGGDWNRFSPCETGLPVCFRSSSPTSSLACAWGAPWRTGFMWTWITTRPGNSPPPTTSTSITRGNRGNWFSAWKWAT